MTGLDEPPWLFEARELLGLREIKGSVHEPKILQLWHDAGLGHIRDDETAWCSAFVGGTLNRGGFTGTRKPNARSYCDWGIDVFESGALLAPLGAVLVFPRPPSAWQGHVAYAVGYNRDGQVLALGGNQKDSVSIAPFDPRRVIAARMPSGYFNDLRLLRRLPLLNIAGNASANEA